MGFANVGTVDRIFRLIVGAALVAAVFVMNIALGSAPGIAMLGIGGILIVTALIRFCPIYGVFGWRTKR